MPLPDLTEADRAILAELVRERIAADRFPLSPLVCTRRTASSANSFVNRRCCVIEFLIAHRELSTFPKQVQTAATIADEAVRLFAERLHLAPQDILFVFHEVEPKLPRFPVASIRREVAADA